MKAPASLGQRLQKLRKDSGVSRQLVADEIGCTREYVRKLELDRIANPGLLFVQKLAALYKVNITDLVRQ